jgi:hypothetical protein
MPNEGVAVGKFDDDRIFALFLMMTCGLVPLGSACAIRDRQNLSQQFFQTACSGISPGGDRF